MDAKRSVFCYYVNGIYVAVTHALKEPHVSAKGYACSVQPGQGILTQSPVCNTEIYVNTLPIPFEEEYLR